MRTHIFGVLTLSAAVLVTTTARAQVQPPPKPGVRSVKVVAGERYKAGTMREWILGETYRDLWTTPIEVPVLDLSTHAGGLKATKTGGGKQATNLRFENPDGYEFVFRKVDKDRVNPPEGWEKTIVEHIARDQISAHHPAAAVVADRFLEAAGVVHASPMLVVMPDDPQLGEFREEFAGRLGIIEPFPNVPEGSPGFAGAIEIIDSDSLRVLINRSPRDRVDAREYLKARLIDIFLNDWDRHEGNWKWARMEPEGPWIPIPRDRDKVLLGYGGIVNSGEKAAPVLIDFDKKYPNTRSFIEQSLVMDRRILSGLEQSAYDSTATFLTQRFTDEFINEALRAMPVEYHASIPETAAKLRARRDQLPVAAREFYQYFVTVVDVHGTDAPETARITVVDGRYVDIEIRSSAAARPAPEVARVVSTDTRGIRFSDATDQYYRRRFDSNETEEIRLYLHGGDDRVEVAGEEEPPIRLRVIGGTGTNSFQDAESAAGRSDQLRFYDEGTVENLNYPAPSFDWRPRVDHAHMERNLPTDQGANSKPIVELNAPGDLGLVPTLGVQKTRYGFRRYPYHYRLAAFGEYALGVEGWRLTGTADKRSEDSDLHWKAAARMSELEVLNFYGFGNDVTATRPEGYYEVQQRQWQFQPAIAYAVGTRTDLAFGPVVKYSTVESGAFLGEVRPYGYGDFGQAGVRLGLYGDSRDHSKRPGRKVLLDLSATYYPKLWDVTSDFTALSAITASYIALPLPLRPILAVKAGGRKLYGEFPFHEAAFIGGRPSDRGLPRERYAGDASLYGTAELRVPIIKFAVLLPIDVGAYVYADAARVYLDGASPGGWHNTEGVGMWIGVLSPNASISVESGAMTGMQAKIGLSF